ncbi:MAG: heat-shock protein Hsp20 [Acidobacteria bacterium]|nr:MAG: heat-shock protein Hsp20 [Acidobacteriota bacterium]PIE89478.1 MAG: heat-shock protein Hsp20 [Acidobacteriota bacterium]
MSTKELVQTKKEALQEERTSPEKYYMPLTDIMEYEDRLVLHMDMPGISKDKVRINVEDSKLNVETEFNSEKYSGLKPLYSEYNVGPFTRSFTLSTKIDQAKIEAAMKDGVLSITLPKKVELARKISVN